MTAEQRLSLDWELWVVEHLLFTARRDDLRDVLVKQGLSVAVAAAQVDAIASSDGLARLRARLAEGVLAARLQEVLVGLHPPGDVPVAASIDVDTLLREHWVPSRPIVLTDVARDVPAVRTWTLRGLAARFADVEVEVNVDRLAATGPADTETRSRNVAFGAWIDDVLARPGNDRYAVSRNGLLANPALRPLWDDLVNLPPFLVPPDPPRGVSLWLGPAGTRTPAHFDPHNVLLVQVEGRKRVRLAPRLRADQHDLVHGWYLRDDLTTAFGDAVKTVEIGPGDALFVPVGWFHEVEALDPSMTLSFLCFRWPNHFHGLGPSGLADRRQQAQ